jgi:hypothetical protein
MMFCLAISPRAMCARESNCCACTVRRVCQVLAYDRRRFLGGTRECRPTAIFWILDNCRETGSRWRTDLVTAGWRSVAMFLWRSVTGSSDRRRIASQSANNASARNGRLPAKRDVAQQYHPAVIATTVFDVLPRRPSVCQDHALFLRKQLAVGRQAWAGRRRHTAPGEPCRSISGR